MAVQCLKDHLLDVLHVLAEELLAGEGEDIGRGHDLDLRNPGHGDGHALRRLDMFTDWVERHQLQGDPASDNASECW